MEAMAAGVPIVATGVRENRDLVDNKETGILVKPGDLGPFQMLWFKCYRTKAFGNVWE